MPKKKIVLFIVEGTTEQTSLETVLSKIFTTDTVRFQIMRGDITSENGVAPDNIISKIFAGVKTFMGGLYKKSDILQIIHLLDTDGAFIPDEAVVTPDQEAQLCYPFYDNDCIITPAVHTIVDRNQRKQANMRKIMSVTQISSIPYRAYYCSSNLEHVLHNRCNLASWEKRRLAEDFDRRYGNDVEGFVRLLCESPFAVCDDYGTSWRFITQGTNSLRRYSNFGIALQWAMQNETAETS